MATFRLVIADDHPLFRDALRLAVSQTVADGEIAEADSFDSLCARLDSTLHVRGRLIGGPAFELSGDVQLLRRGVGELRVTDLVVDGALVSPDRAAGLLTRAGRRVAPSSRLRFDVPSFVDSIRVSGGSVEILKRER